jgi:hypothetical protein
MKMKRMKVFILAVFIAMFAIVSCWAQGGIGVSTKTQDASNPILLKYLGTSTNRVSVIAGGSITVVADGLSQSLPLESTVTVSRVVGWLNSITNTSGYNLFSAIVWEALGTDSASNSLVTGTNVVSSQWDANTFFWDTSACLHYDVVPDMPPQYPSATGGAMGGYTLNRIWGNPDGTGNVTVDVYLNDVLTYERVVISPVYLQPSAYIWGGTNPVTNSLTADNGVEISGLTGMFPGIHVGGGKRCLVRAKRATTATTGVIGANTSR